MWNVATNGDLLPPPSNTQTQRTSMSNKLLGDLRKLGGDIDISRRPLSARVGISAAGRGSPALSVAASALAEKAHDRLGDLRRDAAPVWYSSGNDVPRQPAERGYRSQGSRRPSTAIQDAWARQSNADREQEFEESYRDVFNSINAALSGQQPQETTTLTNGTAMDGSLVFGERRFYVLRLPRRPVAVNVYLSRISGDIPVVYGSTTHAWPGRDRHEFETQDEYVFLHNPNDLPQQTTGANAAPSNNNGANLTLYMCVESASPKLCEYRIRAALRRPNMIKEEGEEEDEGIDGVAEADVVLKRKNATMRVAKMLDTLRNDPIARKTFDERLQRVNHAKARAHARDVARFDADHRAHIERLAEQGGINVTRQPVSARLNLAARRREEVEKAKEERMQWWANREEAKQLARAELAARQAEEESCLQRQSSWVEKLAVVSFCAIIASSWQSESEYRKYVRRQTAACQTIQRWMIKCLSRWRRRQLYFNVVAVRHAFALYTRHVRSTACQVSHSRVRWFLQGFLDREVQEAQAVVLSVKRFHGRVRVVQRNWRRIVAIRQARVEALQNRFLAEYFVKDYEEIHRRRNDNSSASSRKTIIGNTKRRSKLDTSALTGVRKGSQGDDSKIPLFVRLHQGEEQLPAWLRTHVLREHVRFMQVDYPRRLEEWKRNKKQFELEEDLVRMGLGGSAEIANVALIKEKPKPLELSILQDLYSETFDAYFSGGFKHMLHNRNRITKKVWLIWRRLVNHLELPTQSMEVGSLGMTQPHLSRSSTYSTTDKRKSMAARPRLNRGLPVKIGTSNC